MNLTPDSIRKPSSGDSATNAWDQTDHLLRGDFENFKEELVGSNQYSEISEAVTRPPFLEWWEEADDILKDWNEVQRVIS